MNRVAVVTGAAGGIGEATVADFVAAGWDVAAVDRRFPRSEKGKVRTYPTDVSLPEGVELLFGELTSDFGRLDALVNNAAIQVSKPLLETSVDDWDEVMASNLRSAFLMARYGHPLLRQSQGAIVNVSSVHAVATSAGMAAYVASKGGLAALTRAMAIEFAPDSIRVNAILPGAVDTPMLRAGLARGHLDGASVEENLAELGRRSLMGRVGMPVEIARVIRFLSDGSLSSFITGQLLIVDGGATARLSTE
jgi:NAD(P)-dependent dehydrogenase (short-subunit alcohol dehydrogenase family)